MRDGLLTSRMSNESRSTAVKTFIIYPSRRPELSVHAEYHNPVTLAGSGRATMHRIFQIAL